MRRALLKQWPALTKFYGIMPWHVNDLTLDELAEYTRQMNDYHRDQKRQQQRQR